MPRSTVIVDETSRVSVWTTFPLRMIKWELNASFMPFLDGT